MPYDLSKAFEAIEDELIGGIIRNLGNHKAEENQLGFEWEQWQALQIKALEDYRRKNLKKFPPRYNKLNNQIRNLLLSKYNDGQTTQERQIMQAIRRGFKSPKVPPKFTGKAKIEGDFFTVNDRKLDALIQSVTHDMERAEYAVLRLADDQYRKIIFNAQVYANTGAGTYEKAVDMAARDFLRAGVNSIEYKNGSRHTITDYADMAIKTASKRAYLQGEGKMRGEWKIYTVILNKRACPCPLCAPFVGKVFIDDVWSGGQAVAGTDYGISPVTGIKYPLLSSAIRQGLYHPRCRDVHTTYFEGISTPPEESEYTAEDLEELADKYNAEQKQAYCERQEKRYDRISKYSLAPDNQRMYGARAKEWGQKAGEYEQAVKSFGTVEKSGESGIIESEMYRRKGESHRRLGSQGQQIIDKPTYKKITKAFLKRGGIIISGDEAKEHLKNVHAYAAYLPSFNTAFISDEATVSEVIEEMYHAEQDFKRMYGEFADEEVVLRREIDAQKYLLSLTEKYKIPKEEVELTKYNLSKYEKDLEEYLNIKKEE